MLSVRKKYKALGQAGPLLSTSGLVFLRTDAQNSEFPVRRKFMARGQCCTSLKVKIKNNENVHNYLINKVCGLIFKPLRILATLWTCYNKSC